MSVAVDESWIDADRVPGTPKAVAGAERIMDRYAFDAATDARGKPANSWNGVGDTTAIKVLIRRGQHVFILAGAERRNAGCIRRAEEVDPGEVESVAPKDPL